MVCERRLTAEERLWVEKERRKAERGLGVEVAEGEVVDGRGLVEANLGGVKKEGKVSGMQEKAGGETG